MPSRTAQSWRPGTTGSRQRSPTSPPPSEQRTSHRRPCPPLHLMQQGPAGVIVPPDRNSQPARDRAWCVWTRWASTGHTWWHVHRRHARAAAARSPTPAVVWASPGLSSATLTATRSSRNRARAETRATTTSSATSAALSVRAIIVCGVTAAATPGPRQGRSGLSFSDATPAEVRTALIPEEAAEFDQQWREVMARATEMLDLSEVLATLESWRGWRG